MVQALVGLGLRWGRGRTGGWHSSPCRAVGQMMSTMFYPLVTFVLLLICIAYWAMIALYPLPTQPDPPGVPGDRGQKGQCLPTQYALVQWGEGTSSSGQAQPCPWTELEERAQAGFQPLCAVNILHEHLGRGPCKEDLWSPPCDHAFLDSPLGTWPHQDNLSTSSGHPMPAYLAVRQCQ